MGGAGAAASAGGNGCLLHEGGDTRRSRQMTPGRPAGRPDGRPAALTPRTWAAEQWRRRVAPGKNWGLYVVEIRIRLE